MPRKSFDRLLLEAIDEALGSLGESAKQAIYFHLQQRFHLPKEEIPKRIDEFTLGLEKILGLGAKFLEILIIRRLYERVGETIRWREEEEFTFKGYVEVARRNFRMREDRRQ